MFNEGNRATIVKGFREVNEQALLATKNFVTTRMDRAIAVSDQFNEFLGTTLFQMFDLDALLTIYS